MENNQNVLNMLGLAMRAGKLVSGEEITLKALKSKKLSLVLIAGDVSENTNKKIHDKCQYYETPVFTFMTKADISHAIGRSRSIIGVTDRGFAQKMRELMVK
ncbi:YlxQ-related RNA-binding protein [Vagococcus vulneris]|uniref:50S ribosomal protein L7 n=1 Tax=Vagococcus vulneris TaxID=1977869 RepID=A0A429ZY10_9ENTE|nr:YlxQ-related RNA-binding protein [Vagococcus vulneris]RST98785.1 50S ribosomal protein L7 [Vagococcus vulneris]